MQGYPRLFTLPSSPTTSISKTSPARRALTSASADNSTGSHIGTTRQSRHITSTPMALPSSPHPTTHAKLWPCARRNASTACAPSIPSVDKLTDEHPEAGSLVERFRAFLSFVCEYDGRRTDFLPGASLSFAVCFVSVHHKAGDASPVWEYYEVHRSEGEEEWVFREAAKGVVDDQDLHIWLAEDVVCEGCGGRVEVCVLVRSKRAEVLARGGEREEVGSEDEDGKVYGETVEENELERTMRIREKRGKRSRKRGEGGESGGDADDEAETENSA